MKLPIRINTVYGTEQFSILFDQRAVYTVKKKLTSFQNRCKADYDTISVYLRYFLEDDKMMSKYRLDEADKEGWKIFNEMSDMASVLLYFSGIEHNRTENWR